MLAVQELNQNTIRREIFNVSPPVVFERLRVKEGAVLVAREDLLEGGTKQRAVLPLLEELIDAGFSEFVYASPFCGYAQVALASACRLLGVTATIFCERDPTAKSGNELHLFAKKAQHLGAGVKIMESLNIAEKNAEKYTLASPRRFCLPLGFDCPSYHALLSSAIEEQLDVLFEHSSKPIQTFWLPLGSGTLARVFDKILPKNININCVNVRVLGETDPRIASLLASPRITLWRAPEKFAETASLIPPIHSNIHYDAKLWRFVEAHATDGDVWWNVGP